MKSDKFRCRRYLGAFVFTSALMAASAGYAPAAYSAGTKPVNIAVYRGKAGCEGCSEMVVKSLVKTGLNLSVSYIGENEKLKLNSSNLKKFDLYIQPGADRIFPQLIML